MVTKIKKAIDNWSTFGILSDYELTKAERAVDILMGLPSTPETENYIRKGLDAIERRYTYLEETAFLGNNWW